jgi:PE-PPE domain
MSGRTLRLMGLGMVATAGAGFLSLAAMMDTGSAHAQGDDAGDIGLVMGGSGLPIPGSGYVQLADGLYLNHVYPGEITSFYGATTGNPFGEGLFTPEGLYPLTGVHTLPLNYPSGGELGLPTDDTSAGQGITILANQIESNASHDLDSTVFGYSQSSTLAGLTMEQLHADGVSPNDVNFLLIADPSNPNGGLLSRFDGFTTTSGGTQPLELNLPSLGVSFDGATPSDLYTTSIYSVEYDGFTDFPKYPINFLSDLNAFLGIEEIHGHYLDFPVDGSGPSPYDIAGATLLPGSAGYGVGGNPDSMTDYYMITSLGATATTPGTEITPPLVALLPAPLQALLGPDLTYLINLGYGDGSQGYSVDVNSPADVNTPFGLFPDVSMSQMMSTLATDTQTGITNFEAYMADPTALATSVDPTSTGQSVAEVMAALQADIADPSATITELVNAITTSSSAAYSTLLPTADIINTLVTSMPSYDLSLFTDNIGNGDLADAFGLPLAADTALLTLAGGFEVEVIQSAASEISAAFSGLF